MNKTELKAIKREARAIAKMGGAEGALATLILRLCEQLDPDRQARPNEKPDSEAWEMEERRRDRMTER